MKHGLRIAGWMIASVSFAQEIRWFEDVGARTGIDAVLMNGAKGDKHQIETMPGGVALLDYDGDGRLDIYLVNGAEQPELKKTAQGFRNRLYRNLGGWNVTALTEAYRRHTQKVGFCRIGSLKSNIGHLGEAAGALGLIKTVLSLQHRELPPSLNYQTPNPRVDFAASPFVVNDRLREWTSADAPRRAGVTALGAGGTNCHVILEEAPARPAPRSQKLSMESCGNW